MSSGVLFVCSCQCFIVTVCQRECTYVMLLFSLWLCGAGVSSSELRGWHVAMVMTDELVC